MVICDIFKEQLATRGAEAGFRGASDEATPMDMIGEGASTRAARVLLIGVKTDAGALRALRPHLTTELATLVWRPSIFLLRTAPTAGRPPEVAPAFVGEALADALAEAGQAPIGAIVLVEDPADLGSGPFLDRLQADFALLRARTAGFHAVAALIGGPAERIEAPAPRLGAAAPLFDSLFLLGDPRRSGGRFGPEHWPALRRLVDLARDPEVGWPLLRPPAPPPPPPPPAPAPPPPERPLPKAVEKPAEAGGDGESAAEFRRRIDRLLRRIEQEARSAPFDFFEPPQDPAAEAAALRDFLRRRDEGFAERLAGLRREVEALRPPEEDPPAARRILEAGAARLKRGREEEEERLRREHRPPEPEREAPSEPPPEAEASPLALTLLAVGPPALFLSLALMRLSEARKDGLLFDLGGFLASPALAVAFPGAAAAVCAAVLAWRTRRRGAVAEARAAREQAAARRKERTQAELLRHERLRANLMKRELEHALLERAAAADLPLPIPTRLEGLEPLKLPLRRRSEEKEAAI